MEGELRFYLGRGLHHQCAWRIGQIRLLNQSSERRSMLSVCSRTAEVSKEHYG